MEEYNMKEEYVKLIESKLKSADGQVFIENEIKEIFTKISQSNSFSEADVFFDQLLKIIEIISGPIFRDEIEPSSFLWDFVRKYDRVDDYRLRTHEYNRITGKESIN